MHHMWTSITKFQHKKHLAQLCLIAGMFKNVIYVEFPCSLLRLFQSLSVEKGVEVLTIWNSKIMSRRLIDNRWYRCKMICYFI